MDDLGPTVRRARRARILGPGARCVCGEDDPIVLHSTGSGFECASCAARRLTGRSTEQHHPAGRANSPLTVAVDANRHALLSDAQHDWPAATLSNRSQSDVRRAAAVLRAVLDGLHQVVLPAVPTIEELIERLEALDDREPR